jgi:hypothetical protein
MGNACTSLEQDAHHCAPEVCGGRSLFVAKTCMQRRSGRSAGHRAQPRHSSPKNSVLKSTWPKLTAVSCNLGIMHHGEIKVGYLDLAMMSELRETVINSA